MSDNPNAQVQNARNSYDTVAADYAKNFRDEMSKKPFDRKMLDWLIEKVGDAGRMCDMGCGSGEIAAYLHGQGVSVCGLDISENMVQQARRLHSGIEFAQGDMLDLADIPNESYGGIAAFYAIVNIPPSLLAQALAELHRVSRANGVLLVTFHIGDEVRHLDEWFSKPVDLDFFFYEVEQVRDLLLEAGFVLEEVLTREPYPDVEVQTRRAYIFARKPLSK